MKELFKGIGRDFSHWNTKMLCRAGIIAALYVVLTCCLGPLIPYGFPQIRPAEAMTLLPIFFPESVPALYIGCMLANLISAYGVPDIFLGSLATLLAAFLTYLTGKIFKNHLVRVAVGGIFPVVINVVYWVEFGLMCANQALWVYCLGIPLYIAVYKLRQRGVSVFTSPIYATAHPSGKTEHKTDVSHDSHSSDTDGQTK